MGTFATTHIPTFILGDIMAKKKENIQIQLGTDIDLIQLLSNKDRYAGKEISLNCKASSFFGVGNIWLTAKNYWCVVPSDLKKEEYNIIHSSINAGSIILGKKFIPPVTRTEDTLIEYFDLFARLPDTGGMHKTVRTKFKRLILIGEDRGWTAAEIINFCLEKEKKNKNRKFAITFLEDALVIYQGPATFYDPPDKEQGLKKVTITPEEIILEKNDGSIEKKSTNDLGGNKKEYMRPSTIPGGSKRSDEALSDIID